MNLQKDQNVGQKRIKRKCSSILHSEMIHKTTPASRSLQKVIDKALKSIQDAFCFCVKLATWKVFFIPLLAWNFLRVFVLFICESKQTNYLILQKNRFVPVIEKGFGETWMLEQDMVTSLSFFPLLFMCEVLIRLLEEQISSKSISVFPWQDRDLKRWCCIVSLYRVILNNTPQVFLHILQYLSIWWTQPHKKNKGWKMWILVMIESEIFYE